MEKGLRYGVYDQDGQEVGKMQLPVGIFGVKRSKSLIHQAAVAQMANARQVLAHAKDRSEVRGGGKKPWRQKGTGRARHGSIRSPLWRGGGATFGPTKERNFSKKINKKMRRKALLAVLSGKVRDNELIVLEKLQISSPKTKEMMKVIGGLTKIKGDIKKGALIVLAEKDDNIIRAAKNISKFETIGIGNLNVVDLLKRKYLIMTREGIDELKTKSEKGPARHRLDEVMAGGKTTR
ncbi:MAG: 50S ribosomal protein L4 [Candidatus Portnoybacteria bacterium]|nr:50S ribosomal protein L4 [Candidatus Portnoybacteria bacterium]